MANYLSQSWLIDRRHALRAMGTFIALPMLDCMVPLRAAEAATVAGGPPATEPARRPRTVGEDRPNNDGG